MQQLRGELDVGERTPTQLEVELRVLARRDAFALHARLHATDLEQFVGGETVTPHVLVERVEQPVAGGVVPRHGASADHGLPFPCLRVALPVADEAVEAAGHGTLLAFGSQVGVDGIEAVGRCRATDEADEHLGNAVGFVDVRRLLALVHEEHVEIAGI